jgi:predicted ATPase/serine/threonine protein kinase
MTLQIGSQVAGYQIAGILGEGGMGIVYEAEHVLLRRKAALKTLLRDLAGTVEFRERFVRESQVVAAIDHPNIIPIYDAGEIDGTAYIAMRYVPGGDLADLIRRRAPLPPLEALSILDQAGAALDAAHARDLVHRDIKPGNILIEETSDRIFLTDFGIVKEQGQTGNTRVGFFLGTIDYAAPEQIEGQEVTAAADLYAFGCVFFECVTGHRPFEASSDMAVMRAHVLDPPPKITALRPDLPAALDAVIEQALAKEASARFESCRAFVEAARLALAASPAATPPVDAFAAAPIAPTPQKRTTTVTNMPFQATPLVGRDAELAEIVALVRNESVRLVTLTGFGGTGKTRLSIEAATVVKDEFDLVILVDLSPLQDPALVGTTIAQALGAEVSAGGSAVEAIGEQVGSSLVLLLLDNFAQVLPAASLLLELLAALPTLKLLVTSHAPLRVTAEREYPVQPLAIPDPEEADLGVLAASPAVALFVERARAARPGFELTEENAAAVASICTRLDGIPLAIELAAARVKLLPPQTLAGRLEHRLELLTGGAADLPARQQTLRGAIDWSYALLEEGEQGVFARLGAFVGGCSLEGAEAVSGAPFGLDLGRTVDALGSLVDKGLVRQSEAADGEPRFSMLGTIREYALYRLEEKGESEQVRRLHTERFLELAEGAEPELTRANQAAWIARLREENGNLRAALTWSRESGNVELGLRLAGALIRFWSILGLMAEGRDWLTDALRAAGDTPAPVRAKAEFAAGYAALGLGEFTAAEGHFTRSLDLASGDTAGEAATRAQLAWIAMTRTSDGGGPALELASESLRQAREVDDKRTASGALNTLAELSLQRGEAEEALTLMQEALALRRGLGDTRLIANSLLNLARAHLARGELELAQPLLAEGRAVAEEIGDTWSSSVALAALGRLRLLSGEPAEAVGLFRDALRLAAARHDKRAGADCLRGLGSALALEGDAEAGLRLLGAAEAALEELGASPAADERAVDDRVRPQLHSHLGDELDAGLASGRTLTLDEAVALALPSTGRTTASFRTAAV